MSEKIEYKMPETAEGQAAFLAEWKPVEERLLQLLPLLDVNGRVVRADTWVVNVDFSKVVEALNAAPDKTGMADRFINEVRKKNGKMAVSDLLRCPAAELMRWRKMGNRVALLPNALVLHMNSLEE